MTILLARIASSPLRAVLAFKGGTALRKLVFGEAGRFSEDLDFACLDEDAERVYLELDALLTGEAPPDEVTVRNLRFEIAGPGTLQARYAFASTIGEGEFDLDVTTTRRPLLLPASPKPLIPQVYFNGLGLDLPDVLTVHPVEMAAEKLVALHRRFENRNPKDAWDLWKWFALSDPQAATLVAHLWPARLWLDGTDGDVRWRGSGWIEQLTPDRFIWDRLQSLLPGGALDAARLLDELKGRLRPWVDTDEEGILADVGDGRRRRQREVDAAVERVRTELEGR